MTISIWRYSHLALAVFSFLFLIIASVTGIILAFDAVNEKLPSYKAASFDSITLAEALPALKKVYPEITEIQVDKKDFVTLQGFDEEGNDIAAYIDPATGKILGTPQPKSAFIQWVTSLHRSLFLHELGRIAVGVTAFILFLIATSGMVLVIQRQKGLHRFFTRIIKDHFAQYYHVILGRIALIPILIIALTGTYLSLVRLNVFPEKKTQHEVTIAADAAIPDSVNLAQFPLFQQIHLSEVKSIEFPFSEDPEDYFTLKLKDREIVVDQFSGKILSEIKYPFASVLANLSLDLHTGQTNIIWAVVLGLACVNILFFIYSGFVITLKRKGNKIKNKYKAEESEFILLVGSENGSTFRFANAIHQQLLANQKRSHITELNKYTVYPNAQHIIIFSSTHGLGDAPANADKFLALLEKYPQQQNTFTSVIGFGSRSYPDFCEFSKEIENKLSTQSWATPFTPLYTINDKSATEFSVWVKDWAEKVHIPLVASPALFSQQPKGLQSMVVVEKTTRENMDHIFTITLRPRGNNSFTSGDLLAIYPANDNRERFYSIGKVKRDIQLVVKHHSHGMGSGFLHQLEAGQIIRARAIRNTSFHLPKKTPAVVMIANGTGIAPFLGMIAQHHPKIAKHLYCGFRTNACLGDHHTATLQEAVAKGNLKSLHLTTSREGDQLRVTHLISRDALFFSRLLEEGGTVMICGSLAMQDDVLQLLANIVKKQNGKALSVYKTNGQILTDCY